LLVPFLTNLYKYPSVSFSIPLWGYFANFYLSPVDSLNGYFKIGHFWSLSVEMQFYLAWPFIIYYCKPDSVKKAIIILLCCTLLLRSLFVINGADSSITFAWTPFRIDGLLIGSLIAIGLYQGFDYKRFNKVFFGLLFVSGSAVSLIAWFHYANSIFKTTGSLDYIIIKIFLPFIVNLFFGSLLVGSLSNDLLSKPFSVKPLRFLAKYSYGIYIFHFLMLPLFNTYLPITSFRIFWGENDLAIYVYFLASSATSVILAMSSYHLLEKHFLNLKYKF
jgi:peptidoglycan/LPS O-acetylase OafA/YrhL